MISGAVALKEGRGASRPELLRRQPAAALRLHALLAAACFDLSLRRLRECPP